MQYNFVANFAAKTLCAGLVASSLALHGCGGKTPVTLGATNYTAVEQEEIPYSNEYSEDPDMASAFRFAADAYSSEQMSVDEFKKSVKSKLDSGEYAGFFMGESHNYPEEYETGKELLDFVSSNYPVNTLFIESGLVPEKFLPYAKPIIEKNGINVSIFGENTSSIQYTHWWFDISDKISEHDGLVLLYSGWAHLTDDINETYPQMQDVIPVDNAAVFPLPMQGVSRLGKKSIGVVLLSAHEYESLIGAFSFRKIFHSSSEDAADKIITFNKKYDEYLNSLNGKRNESLFFFRAPNNSDLYYAIIPGKTINKASLLHAKAAGMCYFSSLRNRIWNGEYSKYHPGVAWMDVNPFDFTLQFHPMGSDPGFYVDFDGEKSGSLRMIGMRQHE